MILIGYHGCDQSTCDGLVNRSIPHLNTSDNPYDWLGTGAYFFLDDRERAFHFAKYACDNPHKKTTAKPILNPAVVGAVIKVDNVWDLSVIAGRKFFSETLARMNLEFTAAGKKIPVNKRKNSDDDLPLLRLQDRAVIDIACTAAESTGKPFDAVQGIFQQGSPLTDLSGFHDLSHTQISIRHPAKSIIGYFVPA